KSKSIFTCITTTAIPYSTLSLHDALPIYSIIEPLKPIAARGPEPRCLNRQNLVLPAYLEMRAVLVSYITCLVSFFACLRADTVGDRKSTRLNSSHGSMSYSVFCCNIKNHN